MFGCRVNTEKMRASEKSKTDRDRRMDDVKGEGIGFRKREIAASSRK